MRVPTLEPRKRFRLRNWIIGAGRRAGRAAVQPARARRLLHRLPVVRLPRPREHLEQPPRGPGGSGAGLHGRVLRDHVREPRDRRPVGAQVPVDGSRRRVDRALPAGRRALHDADPHRRLVVLRADRRHRRLRAMEAVGALHALPELPQGGSAVPQGHRLLRLPAAVPEVHRRVAVRRSGDRAHRHGGRALPQRRHPVPEPVPARHAAGEGAPLGDPRGDGAGEDRAVLPGSVRARLLHPRASSRVRATPTSRRSSLRSTC